MTGGLAIASPAALDRLDFARGGGLVTVVAQDAVTGAVLMVAHADREALERTLATGEMHYRSRTRGAWHKGATSGNVQRLVSLTSDCDGDAVLARVEPAGPACHVGERSCFGEGAARAPDAIAALGATIATRALEADAGAIMAGPTAAAATSSYTARLLRDRNLRLKKLGEEATELAIACADLDRDRAVDEAADLLYHGLVALHAVGAGLPEVQRALADRASAARGSAAVTGAPAHIAPTAESGDWHGHP